MRMPWVRTLALPLLLVATAARGQSGGAYDLGWNALFPGGGVSSQGGGFSVSGGLGQPASEMGGGAFVLQGGFWQGLPGTTLAAPDAGAIPRAFALLPAAPNPFAARTALAFDLPHTARVRLDVFDVSGQRVRTLVDAQLAPGRHRLSWDGTSDRGGDVAAGIYFVHLAAGAQHATSRVVRFH